MAETHDVVSLLLFVLAAWTVWIRAPQMAVFLVRTQDLPVLLTLSATLLLITFWRPPWRFPSRLPPTWVLILAGLTVATLLAWGTYGLMGNYPLSRDEHMVLFDMAVFNRGQLAAPVPPEWRPYALAMVPNFLLNADQPRGFVSDYLPMNALLRLAFSKIADPAWFNPLLVLGGGIALFDISRRSSRSSGPGLLGRSSPLRTVHADTCDCDDALLMTAHLALNLLWLAAFLRGGKVGNSVALATGFVATGLHQLVFHPFFIAPFLLWRLREGESRRVIAFGVAYGVIILWWAVYPLIVSPLVAGPLGHATNENVITDKLIPLLQLRDPRTVGLMILNLLRFAAWQNLALVPLLIGAVPHVLQNRGFARALALGILTWLVFLAIIIPEQGRGYGYRYLHGYLGSFALLAGFGYRQLEQRLGRNADGMVLLMSGVTLVTAIPVLLVETYWFMQPRLAMERLVANQRTPFILIDDNPSQTTDGKFADSPGDYVRNLPNTTDRPLRFSAEVLPSQLLGGLCRVGHVTLITKSDMHRVGFAVNAQERSPKFEKLIFSNPQRKGCYLPARIPDQAARS